MHTILFDKPKLTICTSNGKLDSFPDLLQSCVFTVKEIFQITGQKFPVSAWSTLYIMKLCLHHYLRNIGGIFSQIYNNYIFLGC